MEVRECEKGNECIYEDEDDEGGFIGNEIIFCPVCDDVWMRSSEHYGSCSHLRFFYYTLENEFLYFKGDWDHASFEKSFRKLAHFDDDDHQLDEEQAFKDINHPDVNAVIYWNWDYSPHSGATGYWGYKT
jgi:hypothetical protein|tara:strand:+ start:117 stop:506 length:390 start_codon:yes stop_codon:yes gene_type:complete